MKVKQGKAAGFHSLYPGNRNSVPETIILIFRDMTDKMRLIIVEDEYAYTTILRKTLKRDGLNFEDLILTGRKEFIEALRDFKPDIILSDLDMPEFDGMEALSVTREIAPLIPFILITGSSNEELAVKCMKAGADDYILKGELSRLKTAVDEAIKKKQLEKSKIETEKALLESERIFSSFMEYCPVYFFFKDSQARPIRLSKNYEKLLGRPAEEALGKSMYDLFPADLARTMIEDDLKVIGDNIPIRVVEEFGGKIYETLKFPISSEGQPSYLAGFTTDITLNKETEKALVESNRRINSLVNNLQGIVYQCLNDKDWTMKFLSDGVFELTGYKADDFIDNKVRSFSSIIDPDDQERIWEEIQSAIKKDEHYTLEYRIITVSGEKKWVWERGRGVFEEEQLITLEGIISDITERKQMESDLIKAKEKAEESDRLKTAFLHNISHEIRTPMNAIVGFSSLLKEELLSEEDISRFTDTICQSSNQLLTIINHIVSIATVEAGQEKLDMKKVDINRICMLLYEQFRLTTEKKNLALNFHPGLPDNRCYFECDETKLIQILSNIINNAIKFTEEGGIDFGYGLGSGKLQFYVRDTGVGIKKEFQDRVFERFFQADNRLSGTAGGTGLGLSLSKAYVELMGGKMWLESEDENGSTFFFTLPFTSKIDGEKPVSIPGKLKIVKGKKRTILVAEDEDNNFLLLKHILSRDNLFVIRASDGLDAVNIFYSAQQIDLILMDIKMPKMDGIEAAGIIRKKDQNIPVIAITAYALESDRARIMESGFNDFISKPFEIAKLKSLLNKYLGL